MSDDKQFNDIPLCDKDTVNEWRASFIAFLYSKDLKALVNIDPTKLDASDNADQIKMLFLHVPVMLGHHQGIASLYLSPQI